MSILAQTSTDADIPSPNYGLTDNRVLDEFRIPFGEWFDQSVDWIKVNLEPLLAIIEWPFSTLIDFFVGDILEPVSWVFVVLFFFIVGTLVRNLQVGVFAAVALTVCGLLGNTFWLETARTIGYIGVAVVLCAIIGIPIGVACGRIDSFWQVVRPVLDAMQVVHSFVYMLPFIFFWSIGPVSATMVTMVFALPPLIRLTNLGVRQVPADVVEASRAYGAPERRVLFDVQIPLARQAIMTGINQTLLLSISMLGIAAIMGAGGLGRLLYNALSEQDVARGGSSGLSFFLVAVVLDRVSQTEATDKGSIFKRTRLAWTHRKNPEVMLSGISTTGSVATTESADQKGSFIQVSADEKPWMFLALVGGLCSIASVFFVWNVDGGGFSAFGRISDESTVGASFNGLSASGGSWFGYITLAFGLFIVAAVFVTRFKPGYGPRFFSTDGVLVVSVALLVMTIGYLIPQILGSGLGTSSRTGFGVYLALYGGGLATTGSLLWIPHAPHSPIHPLLARVGRGQIVLATFAVLVTLAGSFSGWSFDERGDVDIVAEARARVAEARELEKADPSSAAIAALDIAALSAPSEDRPLIVTNGTSDQGARLGIWTLAAGLLGLAATLPAAGISLRDDRKRWRPCFRYDERRRWRWSAIACGIGTGITAIGFSWIFVHVRTADTNFTTGVGAFLTLLGGIILAVSSRPIWREFRRAKTYADNIPRELELSNSPSGQATPVL